MTRPSMEHWAKSFSERITLKHLQNTFGQFWDRIWAYLDFWKIFDFFENFRRLDPPSNTGQKFFFEKINPKLVQSTFGHFWERFWAFLEFWNFFWFFWKNSKTRPSMEHWAIFFPKKSPLNLFKTRWDTFWNDFGLFWNFEIFFDFENFVWTLIGTILGIFGFLKHFWFFGKNSKTRPSMEHWAKSFSERITLKHLQNTFGQFWDRIWAYLDFWKFFDFFENFRRLDPPSNTGQKFFFEKINPKLVQSTLGHFLERFWAFLEFWNFFWFWKFRLDTYWDDFGHFWIFETFLIFWKKFEDSTLHGTLGKKFFRKNHPKTSSKHVWTILGSNLGIFGFLKIFWFFWEFSKTRPSIEHWAKIFFRKD